MSTATLSMDKVRKTTKRKARSDRGGTHAVPGRPRADHKHIVLTVRKILDRAFKDGISPKKLLAVHGLDERGWDRWFEIYMDARNN